MTPQGKFIERLKAENCKVYKGDSYQYTVVNPKGLKGAMIYKPLQRLIEIDYHKHSYISIDVKKKEVEIFNPAKALRYEQVDIDNTYSILAIYFSNLEA